MNKTPLVVGFFISGMAALIYEQIWTKELSLIFGSTGYALSTVLASFMSGLAIGSLFGGRIAKRRDPVTTFGHVQIALCLTGVVMSICIDRLSPVFALLYYSFKGMPTLFLLTQFVVIFVLLLVPTILMGMTFPLAMAGYITSIENVSEDSGRLYAYNTIGSVIGALLAGFITIPLLGLNNTIYIASLCNFLAAIAVQRGKREKIIALTVLLLAATAHAALPPHDYYFNLYNASRTPSYEGFRKGSEFFRVVWRKDDPEGTVVITQGKMATNNYGLTIRGKPEGATPDPVGNPSPELMSYLLLAYKPEAKSYLKIGLGTGETVMAASREKGLEKIDVVEINRAVIEASRRYFSPGIFQDRRVSFITADARKYLSLNDVSYDLISSQATDPTDESSGFLFTREYFAIVKNRLGNSGIFGMFLPTYLLREKGSDIVVKTFVASFPYCYSWRILDVPFLIASLHPLNTPPEEIMRRIEAYSPGRTADLEFISDAVKLKDFAAKSPLPVNTDNWPLVEYIAARNLIN